MEKLLDTEDEVLLRDAARGFLDDNAPVTAFRTNRDLNRAYDPALWAEMAQMGWTGVLVAIISGTFALAVVASLPPSRRAVAVSPVDALAVA